MEYLGNGILLESRVEVVKVKTWAVRYSLINGELYRCSFSEMYLRCLPEGGVEQVIEQVHQGVCSKHIEGRMLCHRIVTQSYNWPTMKQKSKAFVRKCDVCQRFANIIHVPVKPLQDESLAFLYVGNRRRGSSTFGHWPTEVHASCY